MSTAAEALDEQQDAQMFKILGCRFINRDAINELWELEPAQAPREHTN